jgi:hypothetical protein
VITSEKTGEAMLNIFDSRFLLILISMHALSLNIPNFFSKKQGIEGYVFRIKGNRMPSPDIKLPPPQPYQTTVYIYELTNIKQVDRQGTSTFYSSVKTKLVKKIQSDKSGYFKVILPAGHYSLFTKKDTLFYSNWFDKDNNIAPVEVLPGKMSKVEVRIDYDASY